VRGIEAATHRHVVAESETPIHHKGAPMLKVVARGQQAKLNNPNVSNKRLGAALKLAANTLQTQWTTAISDPRVATRAREEIWSSVASVVSRRSTDVNPALKASLAELRDFNARFSEYQATGDNQLAMRILAGGQNPVHGTRVIGLFDLMNNTFDAAGMGRIETLVDKHG
jgi:hypothetical protein